MTDHTAPAGDDPSELSKDQGGELVPFPTPATPDAADRRPADDPEAHEPDDPDAVPVDPPPLPASALGPVWERETDRRPVLPAWVTDPATRQAAARWAWNHTLHTASFHAVRVPVYCGRLAARSPRGLGRTIVAVLRWTIDADSAGLRREANWRGEPRDYMALMRARKETVQTRLATLALVLLLLAVAAVLLLFAAPGWLLFLAAIGTIGLLGHAGRRQDRPLIGPAVVTQNAPRLTADIVVRALGSLGLAGINQAITKGHGITFPAPITRDGPGWRAEVDLPYGVTVADLMERRDRLALGAAPPARLRVAGTAGRGARRQAGAVGGGPGHERDQAAGVAAGRPRPNGPVLSGAVRTRPAGPAGGPGAHVRQRPDRRDAPAGQDVRAAGAADRGGAGPVRAAAHLRVEGHWRPRAVRAGRAPLRQRRRR